VNAAHSLSAEEGLDVSKGKEGKRDYAIYVCYREHKEDFGDEV
jgi:hypothetical protein